MLCASTEVGEDCMLTFSCTGGTSLPDALRAVIVCYTHIRCVLWDMWHVGTAGASKGSRAVPSCT